MPVETKIKMGKIPIQERSTNNHNNDSQNKITIHIDTPKYVD